MTILFVLTSHKTFGDTGRETGLWLEEFLAPYYSFVDAGLPVRLSSPKGGNVPVDPASVDALKESPLYQRYKSDAILAERMNGTAKLSSISASDISALVYPGGHGPLWDLAESDTSIALIESFERAGKPIGFVCHAPGVLRHVKAATGRPLVEGLQVTGFTNTEEDAVQLTQIVPFLVEDMLKANGGVYSKGPDWAPYVLTDGTLITGQNPASSEQGAHALLKQLG